LEIDENMIYITGDTHGDLNRFKHPMFKKIKKRDILIICGDFGFIWDGSNREKRILKWLGKRKYDVLFVDGVHENFDELEKYEIEEWCGGKTRKISGKLRQLMRGEIFEIDEKRVLAFGGGGETGTETLCSDGDSVVLDGSSLTDELNKCKLDDFERAMTVLDKFDNKVDYIISYEPPTQIAEFLSLNDSINESLSFFLDEINRKAEYQRWFFGRHHLNKIVASKYFALFDNVISAEHDPTKK